MADENPLNLNTSLPERSDARPWPDAIRAQLNKILVQAHFVAADDQVRLLRHLIELSTNGKIDAAQEETMAQNLFRTDRNEEEALSHLRATYDDLRKALETYFGSRGRNDPVIFELPTQSIGLLIKASDVQLELSEIDADSEESAILPPEKSINFHAIIAMGIMALASGIYFFGIDELTTGPTGPESITDVGPAKQKLASLAVLPFINKDSKTIQKQYAKSISIELAARLGREKSLRIIAPATMLSYASTQKSPMDIAKETAVRYVLSGHFYKLRTKRNSSSP